MSGVKIWNEQTLARIEQYLDRHFEQLASIERAVRDSQDDAGYTRLKGSVSLSATGGGTVTLPVPLGYDWVLQRATITSTANGSVTLYENTTNPSDTLEVIGSSLLYSDAFDNDIFIPSGSQLLIVFAGAGNNGTGTYNLQVKLIKKPAHTHSPRVMWSGGA